MRIGIVTQSFSPVRGGVAENALHTALELQRRGHEVTVITSRFTPFDDDHGLDVRRIGRDVSIPSNGAFVNLTVSWQLRRKLREIEDERHFDIIQIHSPVDPILPLVAARHLRSPLVGLFHTYVSGRVRAYEFFRSQLRYTVSRLAARLAVSDAARQFANGYWPGEYTIVPNGVDVKRFAPDVPAPGKFAPSKDFTIVFIGRMDPRKGLKYLLRAFPQIQARLPNVRMVVVGGGILRNYYARFLPKESANRVSFEGYVSAEVLPGYFTLGDVIVAPAIGGESFGIVLLEAMASGRPIVASNITGYNGLVKNGQDGVLVPSRDSLAIAEAVVALAADPERRKQLGKAARTKALTFAWDRVTDTLEDAFERVVK